MRLHALFITFVVACSNHGAVDPAATTGTTMPPKPTSETTTTTDLVLGKPAPAFSVTASDGTKLDSNELKGKPVVLYFYPKDETPGCTTEACSFRDAWDSLQKKGVVLIGVSSDDETSHKAFADHHKLPFKLVSDSTGELAKRFGVGTITGKDVHEGELLFQRQTIVIGPDGNVKRIYRKVDVKKHAQEILADTQ